MPGVVVQAPAVTPVVAFTANNRPRHMERVLESWSRARGTGDAHLIFHCEPGCAEMASLAASAALFAREATVVVNPERHGPLSNPWHAMETGFAAGAPFVICAEDDTIVSADVLEYFAWCAKTFAADPAVIAVCAFRHHLLPGGPGGVVLEHDFKSWIWGTWADRWASCLRDDWDHDYRHKGWDWRIGDYWAGERGMTCAFPCESRSFHIGETGTHMSPALFAEYSSDCFEPDRPAAAYRRVR